MDKLSIEELVRSRNAAYGGAWKLTGEVTRMLSHAGAMVRLQDSVYMHNWVVILCKLMRLLANPDHLDSWRDIAGYATLCSTDIENAAYAEQQTEYEREMQQDYDTSRI